MTSLAIVTPWQGNEHLAPAYFEAVEDSPPEQLLIVDDGSETPLSFAAVRLETPLGFCGACNAGLAAAETEAVLFLNNDIVMRRPGWLAGIRAHLEPGIVAGPLRFDAHGEVDGEAYPYVDGWCLGMMTEDARALGGFDERYDAAGPAYFSDNALSFAARMAGMRLRELAPGLHHLGGRTGGVDRAAFERALTANARIYRDFVRGEVGAVA